MQAESLQTEYVLASGNQGKLRELAGMLQPLGFALRPQSDWQLAGVEEVATTFIENALLKARHAAHFTGLPSIADDSGLVVPALDGEPGIHSARYAGEDADDQANMHKLLRQLKTTPGPDRRAYFYCALVLLDSADDPAPLISTARWHGEILHAQQGDGGFGYDPLFYVPGRGCSAAELSLEEKQKISHRGQALAGLIRQLRARDHQHDKPR